MRAKPTTLKPDEVFDGLTWRDMPGNGSDLKRMNFSLFKRGRITKAYVLSSATAKAVSNGSGSLKRGSRGRFAERFQSPFAVLALAAVLSGLLSSCSVLSNATVDDCLIGVAELVTGPFVLARDAAAYGRPRKSTEVTKED